MASNNKSHHYRKEDKAKPKEATLFQRYVQRPLSSIRSSIQPSARCESGSDDADRRLNEGSEELLHGWKQSSIFSEPKMLIDTDGRGHFEINDETHMLISAITWKLVIVGIAGPYRCGKSFLMNRLAGESNGFVVGKTTDAATKGIWAWCKIHPKKKETVVLLLDTEGLGDIKKGNKNHDNKILTLITLLCNVLVFNMMGRFDGDSISKLSFATQISKGVKFGNGPGKQHILPVVMPELILCLRDFFLEFAEGIDSPDDYFEDCLKDVEGEDEYNAPRQSLKTIFPIRHCFTFPVPADDETMQFLENAKDEDLKDSFLQKADEFSKHIFKCMPKEMVDSDVSMYAIVDGSIFKGLLEYYVDSIKKDIIPDIEDAFFTASRKENEKHIDEIKDEFKKTINTIELPIDSQKDLQKKVSPAMTKCIVMFQDRKTMDKDHKQEEQLRRDLQKMLDDMKTKNTQQIHKRFVNNLMKKYTSTLKKTQRAYLKVNGYREYTEELNKMKKDFENGLDEFLLSEFSLAWLEFRKRILEDENHILGINLSEEQKEHQRREFKVKQEFQEKIKNAGFWKRLKFTIFGTMDD